MASTPSTRRQLDGVAVCSLTARFSQHVHPTHWLICAQAIGGASGFFVGTDVAYLGGDGNFLRPIVGVEDFDSDVLGIVKAGTSTGLGFCAFQSVQNVTFAQGSAWIDP